MTDKDTIPPDRNELKQDILARLKQGVWEITFNKVNGERRVMPCTLREDLLPVTTKEATFQMRKDNDVISVWCTDANGWRSFKLSNFISINPLYEHKTEELDSNT
jgi:hypothetical protein